MQLLLISNSTSERGYLVHALADIGAFARSAREGVFVPYASVTRSFDAYVDRVNDALSAMDVRLRSIHAAADPARAIREADLIVVGGGNTFHLLDRCRRTGVLEAMRERVRGGARYLGWSAGTNLACPTIRTTNDMPIVDPGSLDALGFIAFQVNPHFTDAHPPGHFGETRSERLGEFVAANPATPVLALPEGAFLRIDGEAMTLGGERGGRWFVHGRDPQPVAAGPVVVPTPGRGGRRP
jgi:dipeptidase E